MVLPSYLTVGMVTLRLPELVSHGTTSGSFAVNSSIRESWYAPSKVSPRNLGSASAVKRRQDSFSAPGRIG